METDNNKSIYQIIKETTDNSRDKIAYDFLDYKCTYKQFIDEIDRCADGLSAIGIKKNDIITVYLPNVPQALILFYAINKIGAVPNFVHPLLTIEELKASIKHMNPTAIVILDSMYEKISEIFNASLTDMVILVDTSDYLTLEKRVLYKLKNAKNKRHLKKITNSYKIKKTVIKWSYIMDSKESVIHYQCQCSEDTAVILLSGGTTGTPKGVCLSSININAAAYQTLHYRTEPRINDSMLAIMPVFHGYGLVNCIHTTLSAGETCILMPFFNSHLFKRIMMKKRPGYILGIPKLYSKMVDMLKDCKIDLGYMKGLYCGGSKLSLHLKEKTDDFLKSKGAKVVIREGYGLTECVGACTIMPEDVYKEGSIGRPYIDVSIKIIDTGNGREVPQGQEGEICINSPTVMKGYFDRTKTESVLKTHSDGKVWLHSGDIGYIDDEGFIFYKDRIKRMLKISGYAIYPSCIEETIKKHPLVEEVCVTGINDEYGEVLLKAVITTREKHYHAEKAEKSIMDYCKNNMIKWSVPHIIEIIDVMPQTRLGKVDYKKIS